MFNNKSQDIPPTDKCIKTGCSGQICSNKPIMSTCEWTCEDACVRSAKCKNINNSCQWDIDENIQDCLNKCKQSK